LRLRRGQRDPLLVAHRRSAGGGRGGAGGVGGGGGPPGGRQDARNWLTPAQLPEVGKELQEVGSTVLWENHKDEKDSEASQGTHRRGKVPDVFVCWFSQSRHSESYHFNQPGEARPQA